MVKSKKDRSLCVILGAGASRGVSYQNAMKCLSPLDADFFEILAQQEIEDEDLRLAARVVLDNCRSFAHSDGLWDSFEKAFYTMHLRSVISREILDDEDVVTELLVESFTRCLEFLFRRAHGKRICSNHAFLFGSLSGNDSILSFNYDLVAERALGSLYRSKVKFGKEIYGGSGIRRVSVSAIPILCKMHGSSNWQITGSTFDVRQTDWVDFDKNFGYRAHKDRADELAIVLPYWEKKIEEEPWKHIWQDAARNLLKAVDLLIWGYSLPETDVKAREFFRIIFEQGNLQRLIVIDPSEATRKRWRQLVPWQKIWQFGSFEEFKKRPPQWFLTER